MGGISQVRTGLTDMHARMPNPSISHSCRPQSHASVLTAAAQPAGAAMLHA